MDNEEFRQFIIRETDTLRKDLLAKLEEVKNNQILIAINQLSNRITALEDRLATEDSND